MPQSTIRMKMDERLKKQFEQACNELGMSMSTALTLLAEKVTQDNRLPFELSIDPSRGEHSLYALGESTAPARQEPPAIKPPIPWNTLSDG